MILILLRAHDRMEREPSGATCLHGRSPKLTRNWKADSNVTAGVSEPENGTDWKTGPRDAPLR